MLVNPLFCKEEKIIDGTIFFDTCSMTVRFFGMLKGEKQKENEIRKWNDHLTNLLGVEIEREFGIKLYIYCKPMAARSICDCVRYADASYEVYSPP